MRLLLLLLLAAGCDTRVDAEHFALTLPGKWTTAQQGINWDLRKADAADRDQIALTIIESKRPLSPDELSSMAEKLIQLYGRAFCRDVGPDCRLESPARQDRDGMVAWRVRGDSTAKHLTGDLALFASPRKIVGLDARHVPDPDLSARNQKIFQSFRLK
jgi:hypothetical protein